MCTDWISLFLLDAQLAMMECFCILKLLRAATSMLLPAFRAGWDKANCCVTTPWQRSQAMCLCCLCLSTSHILPKHFMHQHHSSTVYQNSRSGKKL